jgi:hypothetical protein
LEDKRLAEHYALTSKIADGKVKQPEKKPEPPKADPKK